MVSRARVKLVFNSLFSSFLIILLLNLSFLSFCWCILCHRSRGHFGGDSRFCNTPSGWTTSPHPFAKVKRTMSSNERPPHGNDLSPLFLLTPRIFPSSRPSTMSPTHFLVIVWRVTTNTLRNFVSSVRNSPHLFMLLKHGAMEWWQVKRCEW